MNHLRFLKKTAISVLFIGICFQFGCQPKQPLYLSAKGHWQNQYIGKATQIEYPNVDIPSIPEVCDAVPPFTLDNPDPTAMWDLTLEEAIHMALKNSTVIRTLSGVSFSQAGVNGVPGALLQSPASIRTVYDTALVESDPRFGQEAALAAFDAHLDASAKWIKSDTPYRSTTGGTFGIPSDGGVFDIGISKYAATGTRFSLKHSNLYNDPYSTDVQGKGLATWSNYLEGGFVHPLLRGSGLEFNRIAGPNATPGSYNGVVVARISTDQSLNDFEMATRNIVADVEKAYWSLYYAYHRLDSVRSGWRAAQQTYHQTRNHAELGGRRGNAQNLAQSENNLFTFQQQMELAQNNLFNAEQNLRYILGQAASDGRLIRPIDEPITAPMKLDWYSIRCEALFRSPELRKQRWEVKRRELELTASKNFLLPNLDLEAGYRISGAGKDLMGSDSAYNSLTGGNYTGWTVGLTASAPFGWRREQAGARNAQLRLMKEKKLLQEQELELTHQLTESFRAISLQYQQMQTTLGAYRASTAEVLAVQNAYELGETTLDLLLQAQRRKAESETAYYSSVIDYNLAIMTLHYRKGSLLEYNNVCLLEGPWPGKAYFDAQRRARERDAGHYFNYGFTLPNVVSRGAYMQHQNQQTFDSMSYDMMPMVLEGEYEETYDYSMPLPPAPSQMMVDPHSVQQPIPTPVLPRATSPGNTPVSFVAPMVAEPTSTLTPTRNRRYVQ